MKPNINKFSLPQLTSNSDGKTSASGTLGALTMGVGVLCFLIGAIESFVDGKNDIMTQSIIVITIGAGLLGFRKNKAANDAPIVAESPAEPSTDATSDEQPINS